VSPALLDARLGHDPGVLSLTQVTGREVRGSNGQVLGRLADLTTRLDDGVGPHLVERILVSRRRRPDLLVPWAAVERFEDIGVVIHDQEDAATFAITSTVEALAKDEILLARDVLDTQIVDIVGQRMARVADVVLNRCADDRLELVGVEVGFAGVLRRLGLRRLAAHANEEVVAWADLHLTSERGHAVQLATPRSAVHRLDAAGLAALVSQLDVESATEILTATGPRVAEKVIRIAHPVVGERVLRAFPGAVIEQIVAAMPVEHARRWRARLAHMPALRGRRFIRSRVWPRRRHAPASGRRAGGGGKP
jgi:sporulation protein YlmC with PRC-barrel domain